MNQHFRAVPGIPNPRSPLAPNKNGANYELARDENVLVFCSSGAAQTPRPIWSEGWTASLSPRASEGGQSWGHPELGERRTQGRAGGTQNSGSQQGSTKQWILPRGISITPRTRGMPARPRPAVRGTAAAPVPTAPARRGPFEVQKPPWATRSSQGRPRAAPCGQPRAGTRLSSAGFRSSLWIHGTPRHKWV